ncbi:hypothetical protein DPMN_134635 [Dreissena polymorpha]|uniref:Uncharacterized protein n=1 Tax=Dreissena polymorpha TaxID=45954 RepID=A0A9D4JAV4_DREPO|nr:hypothetical protein DPMN_134635 [Dreissena polymorpha]
MRKNAVLMASKGGVNRLCPEIASKGGGTKVGYKDAVQWLEFKYRIEMLGPMMGSIDGVR